MALLEQIFIAVISIICFLLRYYFKDLSKKKSYSERKKFELISVLMMIASIIGIIWTVGLIGEQMMATTQIDISFLKLFFLFLIIAEIINYKADELFNGMSQFLAVIVSVVICAICIVPGVIKWESNINKVETQKYSQEQFELVEIFDDTKQDSSINVQTSISKFFKYEVKAVDESQDSDSSEEESKTATTKPIYEICYIDKSEENQQIYKTIDFEETSLKPVPEGQEPYMIVKTYTSYSINNNVDPPEECDFEYTYKYELYVPREDIEELSKLLKKK